jgi:drug/metabolite transporter (DMT)-like permease
VGVIVGLLAAGLFGTGDFLGGRASREASAVVVLFAAQLSAGVGAVVLAAAFGGEPTGRALSYGAAAGLVNATGLGLLFRGLASGRMGVVAPVTAVVGAVIPVGWGLVTGERPGGVVLVGVGLAVCAGALISREEDAGSGGVPRAVVIAIGAGVGFGTSFVLFAHTGDDSGLWPVLSARILAAAAIGAALLAVSRRIPLALPASLRRVAIGAGLCDVAATAFLLVGIRNDLAVVVAPIAALAPAFTVGWAWGLLHERISRPQVGGLVVALCGLVLIAAG